MKSTRFSGERRRPRGAVIVAALSIAAIGAIYPIGRIVADDNEVILSIEILDVKTGAPVPGGSVRVRPGSGLIQDVGHGEHATVEEGDRVQLEARLPAGVVVHHWSGATWANGAKLLLALHQDSVVRLFALSTETTPEDAEELPDSNSRRTSGAVWVPPAEPTPASAPMELSARAPRLSVVWVDFHFVGPENGTPTNPFNTLLEGVAAVPGAAATTLSFKPGFSMESLTIDTPMTMNAPNGPARIGIPPFTVTHTLTTSVIGSGSITGGGIYPGGATAALDAFASTNWAFSHWQGALSSFTNPTTILMDNNKSVTAVFVQNPANLTVTAVTLEGGGALPSEAVAGQTLTLTWHVLNSSGFTALSGDSNWVDNVFLSRDNAFGPEDKALSASGSTHPGSVAAGGEYDSAAAEITIPDTSPGAYYLIVRTDTGSEVSHTASARAAAVFAHPITLKDPELTL